MKRYSVIPVVLMMCGSLTCFAENSSKLIVPGKQIGVIRIGMERAEVFKQLGAPVREDDLAELASEPQKSQYEGILRDDWITPMEISNHPEDRVGIYMANFFTVYTKDRRVIQIEIRDPQFKTVNGTSSLSTAMEWRKFFPVFGTSTVKFHHPSRNGWPAPKHYIVFENVQTEGISWRYAEMGGLAPDPSPEEKVEAVAVYAPDTALLIDPDGGSRFIWKDAPLLLSTEH